MLVELCSISMQTVFPARHSRVGRTDRLGDRVGRLFSDSCRVAEHDLHDLREVAALEMIREYAYQLLFRTECSHGKILYRDRDAPQVGRTVERQR